MLSFVSLLGSRLQGFDVAVPRNESGNVVQLSKGIIPISGFDGELGGIVEGSYAGLPASFSELLGDIVIARIGSKDLTE